jgi:hypothetical protein
VKNIIKGFSSNVVYFFKIPEIKTNDSDFLTDLKDLKFSDLNQIGISEIQTVKDSTGRFRIAPGHYLILPFVECSSALKQNDKLEFMIRIFADNRTEAK